MGASSTRGMGAYAAAGAVALHRHGAAIAPFTTRTAPYRVRGTVPLAGHGEITPASGLNSRWSNKKRLKSCKLSMPPAAGVVSFQFEEHQGANFAKRWCL